MNKGIVMEMTEAHLVVLTPVGQFLRVPRGNRVCELGDEILFSPVRNRFRRPVLTFISTISAAIIICIVAFTGITPHLGGIQPIVAYVTLDINPSVELGIDAKQQVLDVRGLNEDGVLLIEQLKYKGKSLDEVTVELLARVEIKGIWNSGEGDIIISSSKAYEEAAIDEVAIGQVIRESVDKHIQTNHPQNQAAIHVASLVTPVEIREAAKSEGVSAGKYALYLNAKSIGTSVTIEEMKTQSIHKIAEDRGGLDKLIDTNKVVAKETFYRLLQEEKKGELDAKLKESNSKDGKSDNKNTSNKNDDKKNDDKKNDNSKNDNKTSSATNKKPDYGDTISKPTFTPAKYESDRDKKAREEAEKKKAEQAKKESEDRQKAEQKKKEEEEKKKEELRKRDEENKRKAELKKKEEEEEEEKKKLAAEQKRKEEEERKREEEDRNRSQGDDRRNQENDESRKRQVDDNRRD